MRILLFEHFTGGWCDEAPPVSMYREGEAMLHALAADLKRLPEVELSVLRDARLPAPEFAAAVIRGDGVENRQAFLRATLSAHDAFWPIAPETGGMLKSLCKLAQDSQCKLLNSSAAAVDVAGDKLATVARLREVGVNCIETRALEKPLPLPYPVVVKPNDGVGCGGQSIVRSEEQLISMGLSDGSDIVQLGARSENRITLLASLDERYIVQPYLEGISGSLSLIVNGSSVRVLAVNKQNIKLHDDTFVLDGCDVGAGDHLPEFKGYDWQQLAESVRRAIPGLFAYVGVDFIIADGRLVVLEVNPRLTTSYVGLSQAVGLHPIEYLGGLLDSNADDIDAVCQSEVVA